MTAFDRLSQWTLRSLITHSQWGPFAARGSYSGLGRSPAAPATDDRLQKAAVEYADSAGFAVNYPFVDFGETLQGARVLDLGSGFGGRTAWLAEQCGEVVGVEVFPNQIEAGSDFAASKGLSNAEFRLGTQAGIPCDSGWADFVISYDVLEHVEDPPLILREIDRVLRPGGKAFLIFTPYLGMFSHHLNYITLLPSLHWVFHPRNIVASINHLLEGHPRFHGIVKAQPEPRLAYHRRWQALPSLNGMTGADYQREVRTAGFDVEYLRSTPILERWSILGPVGRGLNRALCRIPGLDEPLSHNLVSILRKPGAPSDPAHST